MKGGNGEINDSSQFGIWNWRRKLWGAVAEFLWMEYGVCTCRLHFLAWNESCKERGMRLQGWENIIGKVLTTDWSSLIHSGNCKPRTVFTSIQSTYSALPAWYYCGTRMCTVALLTVAQAMLRTCAIFPKYYLEWNVKTVSFLWWSESFNKMTLIWKLCWKSWNFHCDNLAAPLVGFICRLMGNF